MRGIQLIPPAAAQLEGASRCVGASAFLESSAVSLLWHSATHEEFQQTIHLQEPVLVSNRTYSLNVVSNKGQLLACNFSPKLRQG